MLAKKDLITIVNMTPKRAFVLLSSIKYILNINILRINIINLAKANNLKGFFPPIWILISTKNFNFKFHISKSSLIGFIVVTILNL